MNEEDFGAEEEAGSGDDSDDVVHISSTSAISAYWSLMPAGCRNHHGAGRSVARFPVRFSPLGAQNLVINFMQTALGANIVLNHPDQDLQGCLQTFQQRQEVRTFNYMVV